MVGTVTNNNLVWKHNTTFFFQGSSSPVFSLVLMNLLEPQTVSLYVPCEMYQKELKLPRLGMYVSAPGAGLNKLICLKLSKKKKKAPDHITRVTTSVCTGSVLSPVYPPMRRIPHITVCYFTFGVCNVCTIVIWVVYRLTPIFFVMNGQLFLLNSCSLYLLMLL